MEMELGYPATMIADVVVLKFLYEHLGKSPMRPDKLHNMILYALGGRLCNVDRHAFGTANIKM